MRSPRPCFGRLLRGVLLAAALAAAPGPARAVTLFGLVDTGECFASPDLGAHWQSMSALPVHDAVALVAGNSSSQLFLASASGSVYGSSDAGANWAAVGAVAAPDVTALVGMTGRLLLFTASGDVYRSSDQGVTWEATGTIAAPDVVGATRQALTLFVLTRSGGVYRSQDDGAGWTAVGTLTVSDAVEIAALGGALYALTGTGDVARSTDAGASWDFVGGLSQTGMTSLLATREDLVACTAGGEAASSADGAAWTWRGCMGQLTVRALASDVPSTSSVGPEAASPLSLLGPWPNPAGAEVALTLVLERAGPVTVTVHDAAGREVARPLAEAWLPAGPSLCRWRPTGLPAGAYWLRAYLGAAERVRPLIWLGR